MKRSFCLIVGIVGWFIVQVAVCHAAEVTAEKTADGVRINIDGKPFTEYLISSGGKPILWPVIGPSGDELTRAYPMKKDIEGESRDHVHHRSIWLTHGKINDVDFWLEGKNRGTTQHREFTKVTSGPEAVVATRNDWLGPDGKKVLEDERTLTFGADGERRWIDFDITLHASEGPITFGDTKEGTFGVRVPDTMKVDAKKGGKIVNSEGQIDGDAWGMPAAWVDYYGPVNNKTQGIAILNHPTSFHFPTHWHVRTYGLFAANPFGLTDFKAGQKGEYTVPKGESITFRYRVLLHNGDEKQAKVAESFRDYAAQKKPGS